METVVMRTFGNYFSANILLTRLQEHGIRCYLKDENTVTIDPLLTAAIGGIKLAVDVTQQDEAAVLLKDFHDDELRAAVCPQCRLSTIIEVEKPVKNILTGLLSRISKDYVAPVDTYFLCRNCGWKSTLLSDAQNDKLDI